MKPVDAFTAAYIECALWSSTLDDEFNTPMDQIDADIAPDQITFAQRDCDDFRKRAGDLLSGWTDEQAGHDFWLTRNHHGAGFWDRGLPAGHDLTAIAHQFPELWIYVGDDNLIYGFK